MWSCCSHREPSIVRIRLEIVPADTFNGWSVIANEGRAPTDELMMQWPLWILLDRSSGITTRLHRPSAAHSPEDGGVSRLSLSMTAQAVTIRLRRNPLETRSQRVENSPDSVSCQLSATFQIGVVSFGRTIGAATPVYELFCPPIRFLYDTKKSGTEVNTQNGVPEGATVGLRFGPFSPSCGCGVPSRGGGVGGGLGDLGGGSEASRHLTRQPMALMSRVG